MKINHKFKVTFNLDRYPRSNAAIIQEGVLTDKVEKIDLEFEIDEKLASNFLFKFTPRIFRLEDYSVMFKYDNNFKLKYIVLIKDDFIYIVNNTLKLLSDIHEGYFRILAMNKFNDILEFDFNLEEDTDEIHEEFENEE
jgi:hypothetical protein